MKSPLLKGTFLLSISSVLFLVSGYVVNIALGRYLGPSDYGIYGVVISLWSTVNLVLTTGLPQAVSQNIAASQLKANAILRSSLILQIISVTIISLIFYNSAGLIATIFHDEKFIPLVKLTTLIIPFNSLYSLYLGYYNGLHNFKRQMLIDSTYGIVKLLAVIVLLYFFHLAGAIGGFVVAAIAATIVGFTLPGTSEGYSYKKLILFSIPLIGFTIFSTLHQTIDLLFVKSLLPHSNFSGYYTAAQNISRIPYFVLGALSGAVFPSISKSVSENNIVHTRKLIQNSIRLVLFLTVPISFIISSTSLEVLHFLYTSSYSPAEYPLSILAVGMCLFTIFTLLSNMLSGAGLPKISLSISGIGLLTTTILCTMLIPTYGLTGAATATTIGSGLAVLSAAYFVFRKFGVLFSPVSFIKILISSGIVYLLGKIISFPTILLPGLYIFLFIIYMFILLLLKEFTSEDFILVKSLLPGWISKRLPL